MSSRTSPQPSGLRRPSSTFRTSVLGNHIAAPPPPPDTESERQSPDTASEQTSRRRPPPSERKTTRHSIRIDTRDTVRADSTPRGENPPRRPPSMHAGLEPGDNKARPTSVASSEFDPYYFSVPSPNQSRRASLVPEDQYANPDPAPETQATVKARNRLSLNRTSLLIPETPIRDPGAIDRRALIGVGELATPRWTVTRDARAISHGQHDHNAHRSDDRHAQAHTPGEEVPPSPWTIEAIEASDSGDGRLLSTKFPRSSIANHAMSSRTSLASSVSAGARPQEDAAQSAPLEPPNPAFKSVKPKMSMTEESGGEEILYKPPPRKTAGRPSVSSVSTKRLSGVYAHYREGTGSSVDIIPSPIDISAQSSPATGAAILPPPSAYNQQTFPKARKRTSDEFAMDQSGALISKTTGSSLASPRNGTTERDKEHDDKVVRRHRSLGVGVPAKPADRTPGKERRRGDSVALNMSAAKSPPASTTPRAAGEKHVRQTSASSTSSFHEITHPRRHDFSHLPPSPSTSSIQHFMKHGPNAPAPGTPPIPSHQSSPSVAHSLLRGTQEGWAALEDSSTAEALRKLDGISGKNVRARSSVGSGSRPTTPGQKTGRLSRPGSKEQLGSMTQDVDPPPETVEPKATAGRKPTSRDGPPGPRASFGPPTPKRSSASSTTFTGTPTTGSRDSASLSAATSATSTSLSSRKLRRNSGGSDASSGYAVAEVGRFGDEEAATGEIPPVPPLPKDLLAYKTPPMGAGIGFPTSSGSGGGMSGGESGYEVVSSGNEGNSSGFDILSDAPSSDDPDKTVVFPSMSMTITSPTSPPPVPVPARQPTKKWSFSNALNLRLPSGSPKEHSHAPQPPHKDSPHTPQKELQGPQTPLKDAYVTSPQKTPRSQGSISFSLGPSDSESPAGGSLENWSAVEHSEAADFAPASAPATGSLSGRLADAHPFPRAAEYNVPRTPEGPSHAHTHARTPDAHSVSSASTLDPPPVSVNSPSAKQPRRLTPSSIPFFRRSSSQSMQVQPSASAHHHHHRESNHHNNHREGSSSPTFPLPPSLTHQQSSHSVSSITSASESGFSQSGFSGMSGPPSASKKSSVLNLGSLLKGSSSRKSMHGSGDKSDAGKSAEEKERKKKDDKERSESRISALMGRKRGKTISSAENKRGSKPMTLPPMQMSVLPASTVQRVANLKASTASPATRSTAAGRATSSPASTMSKASDNSLRNSRQHLPTIAGSPSVGLSGQQAREAREAREGVSALSNATITKDTPTKIPRSRRTSLNLTGLSAAQQSQAQAQSREQSPSSANEFGIIASGETPKPQFAGTVTGATQRSSVRASPQSVSRGPRQSNAGGSSSSSSATPSVVKKTTHPVSLSGLRKFSNNSTSFLSPRVTLPVTRVSEVSSRGVTPATPSSSRQSLSTPSPVPMEVDEEELAGDEEMMAYIRRLHARKLASGAKREELDEMLKFPEPIPPKAGMTPAEVLESSQNSYLCDYERKEMLDFPRVYCVGAGSKKNMATRDNSTNNYGYDDERGDYLVIKHDHLAYRYEIIDTLGKGSFGQVLHCRDHCTGLSVGIKIIRNKKRFHHQALVEIKILDNLRKWDPEEKNHVLKMNEHFTFRNHLCIVTELLSINLYELIKANGFAGFTTALIRRFTSQMLASLVLMRQHRIVHCDLKPENVLLLHPAKSALKVIDFGSSCFEHEKVYTYIQSRFYRSPEVILGMNYHMAIDMWSLGCILAELYTGFPIFPGENEQEQLSCIMEVLGVPDKDLINRSSRKRLFFETNGQPRPVVNSKGRRRRPGTKTLAQVLRCDDELFVDFIAKCLIWDPERRLKPQPALRHPFITAGRRPKITSPAPTSSTRHLFTPSSSTSVLASARTKPLATPQKSQIGAPTPLSSRIATRAPTTTTASIPQTPTSNSHTSNLGTTASAQRYRVPASSSAYSSRTLAPASNGYAQ